MVNVFQMIGRIRAAILALLLLLPLASVTPAHALELELDQARARGLVGETVRGYVAAVDGSTPEVTALVNQVNAARRKAYQKIAQRNGTTLEQVERISAPKIYSQVPAGTYIQTENGRWSRK